MNANFPKIPSSNPLQSATIASGGGLVGCHDGSTMHTRCVTDQNNEARFIQ